MITTSDPDFWHAQSKLPLLGRIASAPQEVVDYVSAVNALQHAEPSSSTPQAVQAYSLPADFLHDVREAIAQLPDSVQAHLAPRLLGVFVASGVGSSAITDVIASTDGRILGAVVLLDANAFLLRSANEWMRWKESMPFAAERGFELRAQIADEADNHRHQALQYLLLHEFGHVLSVNTEMLPNWWIGAQKFKDTEEYSFLSICWQIAMDGTIIPLLRHQFPQRAAIRYYAHSDDQLLPADQMVEVYRALDRTGFPSLYAATSVYEDFAESFASYVHVVLMHKPWRLQILHEQEPVLTFENYWMSPRAQRKAAIFAELLSS